jgi:response regulator of citrate/malate metabolism
METYLTAKEVAAKVQLSEQTIRRYTMLRQIPFHKIALCLMVCGKKLMSTTSFLGNNLS